MTDQEQEAGTMTDRNEPSPGVQAAAAAVVALAGATALSASILDRAVELGCPCGKGLVKDAAGEMLFHVDGSEFTADCEPRVAPPEETVPEEVDTDAALADELRSRVADLEGQVMTLAIENAEWEGGAQVQRDKIAALEATQTEMLATIDVLEHRLRLSEAVAIHLDKERQQDGTPFYKPYRETTNKALASWRNG